MIQQRPLRVLIVGPQENFNHVLATNIQCWGGYEATVHTPSVRLDRNGKKAVWGDVLLYDLDVTWQRGKMEKASSALQQGVLASSFWEEIQELRSHTRLMIAMSSGSVSRTLLEQMGAVAHLQKPFEMGRLQRYLKVLRRLVFTVFDEDALPYEWFHHGDRRVLVVDDDKEVAYTIRRCLVEELGYKVVVAHEGLEALEQCLDWRPQCIVTDLIMPWMNGYQMMRCLSIGSLKTIPAFVVISALHQRELPGDHSYLQGKTVLYVDKPFRVDCLLAAVKQACAE